MSNSDEKVEILSSIKTDIRARYEGIVRQLDTKKKKLNRAIGEMKAQLKKLNDEETCRLDVEIVSVKSNSELLNSIKETIEKEEDISYTQIMSNKETILGIQENNKDHLSGNRVFMFPTLTQGQSSIEQFIGRIVMEDVTKNLPQVADKTGKPEFKTVANALQLKYTGMKYA